jgi:chromosome partitioning protein
MTIRQSAHVIVLGNEKGGSGKSTLAMNVIVSLLNSGQSVASLDLDTRQRSLTRFVENRTAWAKAQNLYLNIPDHIPLTSGTEQSISAREDYEYTVFADAVSQLEYDYDFLVIDTPGHDSYLCRLGHAMADTLLSPINDSFIDLDVIAKFSPETSMIVEESQYTRMVRQARAQRRAADGGKIDWIVVRNRLSSLDARNKRAMCTALGQAKSKYGFRTADGLGERVIYRELFTRGLTLSDIFETPNGVRPCMSHLAARLEVRTLIENLNLPDRVKTATPGRSAKDKKTSFLSVN